MLRMYREYFVDHHRFREHLRVAMIMAMVAPACALVFFLYIDWWNPWLWGSCGVGLSLALALYSVVLLHQRPPNMSVTAMRLVSSSPSWFPFFFIVVQSLIAALIVLFIWFSMSSLALQVPAYVHALVVILCCLIPVRRLIWARMEKRVFNLAFVLNELVRAAWHAMLTLFIASLVVSETITNPSDLSQENLIWQTMVWVPAFLYITFTITVTWDHLSRRPRPKDEPAAPPPPVQAKDEPLDRF